MTKLGIVNDDLKIIVDGEDAPREKTIPSINGYAPQKGDRVVMMEHNGDLIIIGSIK